MSTLMTREYADAIGVNPSSVSRAVAKGTIPAITLANGKRMIDRAAADSARRRNGNIARGHGGRADRAVRRQTTWRARSATGYDPAILAALNVMRGRWPLLIRRAMEILGASEVDQARAVLSLQEMVGYLAAMVHDEHNRARVWDWRKAVDPEPEMIWTDPEAQEFFTRWGEQPDGVGPRWSSDEDGIAGGNEFCDELYDAGIAAKP